MSESRTYLIFGSNGTIGSSCAVFLMRHARVVCAKRDFTSLRDQIDQIQNEEFLWLKELPLVEFQFPVVEQSTTGSL